MKWTNHRSKQQKMNVEHSFSNLFGGPQGSVAFSYSTEPNKMPNLFLVSQIQRRVVLKIMWILGTSS